MPGGSHFGGTSTPQGWACSVTFLVVVVFLFIGLPALLNTRRRSGVWRSLEARGLTIVRRPTDRDEVMLARLVGSLPEPWPFRFGRPARNQRARLVWCAVSDNILIVEHRFDAHKRFPVYFTSVTTFRGARPNLLKALFTTQGSDGAIPSDVNEDASYARELGTTGVTIVHKERTTTESIDRLLNGEMA